MGGWTAMSQWFCSSALGPGPSPIMSMRVSTASGVGANGFAMEATRKQKKTDTPSSTCTAQGAYSRYLSPIEYTVSAV